MTCDHTWHTGPGCPVWRGQPYRLKIDLITTLVKKDHNDNFHYRINSYAPWFRLNQPEDYRKLNEALQHLFNRLSAVNNYNPHLSTFGSTIS